jgi:hypothetical protein
MRRSLEDEICPICGKEIQEHPEIRGERREALAQIKRDAGAAITIAVVIISTSLLIVTLMLDLLHQWIKPIEQDGARYLGAMIFDFVFALGLYIHNSNGREGWMTAPRGRSLRNIRFWRWYVPEHSC